MIIVKCSKCRKKIFKYNKMGKGQLLHCWKDRITEDYAVRDGNTIKCQSGHVIGVDEGKWIKMKRHTFYYSGTVIRK